MSSKSKRRREARRRARERREEGRAEALRPEDVAAEGGARPAVRVEPRPARPQKKKARRGGRRLRVSPWLVATPVVAAVIGVLVFLVMSSGSSGRGGDSGSPAATPDPRVAGLTPDASHTIQAGGESDDAYFQPTTVTAKAGDVIELVLENVGTVTHNLRVSGPNGEFDDGDDFEMPPNVVKPGETEKLLVKIDEPGTYPFRCDFHPLVQKGNLVLE